MSEYFDAADIAIAVEEKEMEMTDKPWSPEDMFKPSKEHPQGSSGEWMAEENVVIVRRIYKDGKLVSSEPVAVSPASGGRHCSKGELK